MRWKLHVRFGGSESLGDSRPNLLTTIIMPIALISTWNSISQNRISLLVLLLITEVLLLAVFLALDVLLFYIFFESILIPLFLLIGLFGSSNKVKASFYLFLYTLAGSLFLLLAILTINSIMGAWWSGKSPTRLKLSNSGEALKLWLPRNGTKAICKWINNPLAVTRSKMMKTEIGNHGSKSIIVVYLITTLVVVKEQRVDGSWWEKYRMIPNKPKCISHLRCTLMGFERNYQDSTHSNTIHTSRGFSTRNKKVVLRSSLKNFKLDPNWVTGFVDGEGCFHVSITSRKHRKLGR